MCADLDFKTTLYMTRCCIGGWVNGNISTDDSINLETLKTNSALQLSAGKVSGYFTVLGMQSWNSMLM